MCPFVYVIHIHSYCTCEENESQGCISCVHTVCISRRKCVRVPRHGEQVSDQLLSQAALLQGGHLHGCVRFLFPRSHQRCRTDRQVDQAVTRRGALPTEGSADPTCCEIRTLEAGDRPLPALQLGRPVAPSRYPVCGIVRGRRQSVRVLLAVLHGGRAGQVDRSGAARGSLHSSAVAPH